MDQGEGIRLSELADLALKEALKEKVSDASVLCSLEEGVMVRFSNSSVTAFKNVRNMVISIYMAKEARRIVGSLSNPCVEGVGGFVRNLVRACSSLPPSPDYTPLPKGPFQYPAHKSYDPKIPEGGVDLIEHVKQAIDASLLAGGERVSGSLRAYSEEFSILTTGGVEGEDRRTGTLLNIRAFVDGEASGHGLACATSLSEFDPIEAARTAGEYAKRCASRGPWEEGRHDVVLSPTVAADIVQHFGSFSSAFQVESGLSFLAGKVGGRVANERLTIRDSGVIEGGLNARRFDDEGVPTGETKLAEKGVLKGYLHNSTTAKKSGVNSTGNAGLIDPHPWNLVVEAGDYSLDEMVKEVKKGVLVTNNWYTRFQDLRSGEYSTLPRDASFLIEDGSIEHPVAGIRISDAILRQLCNIGAVGRERRWIMWWEVAVPTLTPALLIKDVPITKAME